MKRIDLIAAAGLAALAVFILFESRKLGFGSFRVPQTGFFPRALGILLVLLTVGEVVRAIRSSVPAPTSEKIGGEGWVKIGATLATMLGFTLLLERVGFLLATFFFDGSAAARHRGAALAESIRCRTDYFTAVLWPFRLALGRASARWNFRNLAWSCCITLPSVCQWR